MSNELAKANVELGTVQDQLDMMKRAPHSTMKLVDES